MQNSPFKSDQKGAALIEFAFVLPILLGITIGTIYYGYLFMLDAAVTNAAKQGAQIAVNLDPVAFASLGDYRTAVTTQVSTSVTNSLAWLPNVIPAETTTVCLPGDSCAVADCTDVSAACIAVELDVTSNTSPLLPQLNLPIIGRVPPLPAVLNGVAQVVL